MLKLVTDMSKIIVHVLHLAKAAIVKNEESRLNNFELINRAV